MPAYPIEPDKLLVAADQLAPVKPGRGRPPYTGHRRAVSTAYYAVYHAITCRIAEMVFPSADAAFQQRVRRWVGHADIRTVARWVSQLQGTTSGAPPPHIQALLLPAPATGHVDRDSLAIAEGFLELNDKREQADYDHQAIFTRAGTRGHLALARQVVAVVETAQTSATERFFGLIAMQSRIQAR